MATISVTSTTQNNHFVDFAPAVALKQKVCDHAGAAQIRILHNIPEVVLNPDISVFKIRPAHLSHDIQDVIGVRSDPLLGHFQQIVIVRPGQAFVGRDAQNCPPGALLGKIFTQIQQRMVIPLRQVHDDPPDHLLQRIEIGLRLRKLSLLAFLNFVEEIRYMAFVIFIVSLMPFIRSRTSRFEGIGKLLR